MMNPHQQSVWSRVFLIITIFLGGFLLFLAFLVRPPGAGKYPWIENARVYVDVSGGHNALEAIIQAADRTDWEALEERRDELRQAAVEGWTSDSESLADLIEAHQPVVSSVHQATLYPFCRFPSTDQSNAKIERPGIERFQDLGFLLVANGRRLAALGRTRDAIERLLDTAELGSRFCRPEEEATLTSHLIGMTMMELSIQALIRILRGAYLEEDERKNIDERLARLEAGYSSITAAFHAEAGIFQREVTENIDDLEKFAQGLRLFDPELTPQEARELAAELAADAASFPQEQERLWAELDAAMALPPYEQPRIDEKWFAEKTNNRIALFQFTNISSLLVRENVLIARIRLCEALNTARIPEGLELEQTDPFSGNPLRRMGDRLYSVGPDGVDELGQVIYDPGAGAFSQGDIVIFASGAPPAAETVGQ